MSANHLDKVASIGCILCIHFGWGQSPAEIHHIREGQGMSQRANDYLTVPLCPEHHRGDSGIHGMGRNAFEAAYRLNELDLLALTIKKLESHRRV